MPSSEYPNPARRSISSVLDCQKIKKTFETDWRDELKKF
ncbi:MAG: NAD(P)-dependent oxidoreductase [Gammaproteobacteria bacterium]|nr:NAD(P)-dependent oxidoreductase [Gammaproteobacteria bacterium]